MVQVGWLSWQLFRTVLPGETKMHRFIFDLALSKLHQLQQFSAHVYFSGFQKQLVMQC